MYPSLSNVIATASYLRLSIFQRPPAPPPSYPSYSSPPPLPPALLPPPLRLLSFSCPYTPSLPSSTLSFSFSSSYWSPPPLVSPLLHPSFLPLSALHPPSTPLLHLPPVSPSVRPFVLLFLFMSVHGGKASVLRGSYLCCHVVSIWGFAGPAVSSQFWLFHQVN